MTHEDVIKDAVKEALAAGVVWTDKEFAKLKNDAIAEVTAETARKLYGNAR